MPKAYYFKEIINNPFIVSGAAAPFQPYPGNRGLLELESPKDDAMIAALDDAAARHRGGIVKLSEAQFLEKKTQLVSTPLPVRRPKEMLRVSPRGPLQPDKPKGNTEALDAAPADAPKPGPLRLTQAAKNALAGESGPTTPTPTEPAPPPAPVGFRPATRRVGRPRKPAPPLPDALLQQ